MRTRVIAALGGLILAAGAMSGCLGGSKPKSPSQNEDVKEFTLSIASNSIKGGKNSAGAAWVEDWVIPKFIEAQKAKGKTAKVTFQASGVSDEDFKSKLALDLKAGSGADVVAVDGPWVGELADAKYLKPLDDLAGADTVNAWEGWKQIPELVQENMSYNGKRYGVPRGTDGRVIFFNKKLFAQAGLPADWQPKTWDEILAAAQKLKALPGVIPLQLNAGTAMGEATTMQGFLPLLMGTGKELYTDGKWQGNSAVMRQVLEFYEKTYKGGALGDPVLQQDAKGRDKSFQKFSENKVGILLEGDYFWRGVLDPAKGTAKMADRDQAVGYALIPAVKAGGGVRGRDFVSMSGGSGYALNPNTKYPKQAWELLAFMNSAEATKAELGGALRITHRKDVNEELLKNDPLLTFITTKVLPVTSVRPRVGAFPRVSTAIQQATLDVVTGKSPADAAATYQRTLESIVGADKVVKD